MNDVEFYCKKYNIDKTIVCAIINKCGNKCDIRSNGRYRAKVRDDGKLLYIGTYDTEEEAFVATISFRIERLIRLLQNDNKDINDAKLIKEKYVIFDDGAIYNLFGIRRKTKINNCGYNQVMFCDNNNRKLYLVHRLVAEAFIPNPNHLEFVNHKDGNKQNNCANNLEWVTKSENERHAFANGLKTTGNGYPIYSEEEKKYIREHKMESSTKIAKHLNRSETGVKNYLRIFRKEIE